MARAFRFRLQDSGFTVEGPGCNLGASIITYMTLGVPAYTSSIMGPETLL